MEDKNKGQVDASEATAVAEPQTANESTQQEDSQESVEDLKAKLQKAEEVAENQRIRAEKAERAAKQPKPEAQQEQKADLSQTDLIALIKADVTDSEDITEVTDYAKLKGISVSEALKSSVVKTLLAEKTEQRKVAAATNTGSTQRSSGKVTDEMLLAKAKKGELPDSDEDMQRLVGARLGANKK